MKGKAIFLKSGNIFFYRERNEQDAELEYAFVITPQKQFVGGFAGYEAQRKLKSFSELDGVQIVEDKTIPNLLDLNYELFNQKIGTASKLIEVAIDKDNFIYCDEVHSEVSNACSERQWYFITAGIPLLYGTSWKLPAIMMIANHLSMFGVENFRESFFKGFTVDNAMSDESVISDVSASRYWRGGYKSPAYYIRQTLYNGESV